MMDCKYYILNCKNEKEPVDPFEWSDTSCRGGDEWQVGKTKVDEYVISTVFVGEGCLHGLKPTVMFETTVYKGEIKLPEFIAEYDTWDEAKLGHLRIVDKIQVKR